MPSTPPSSSLSRPPPQPRPTLFPYTTLFRSSRRCGHWPTATSRGRSRRPITPPSRAPCLGSSARRSEEHTSELQSHVNLVCRLLLEKKKEQKSEFRYLGGC